MSRHRPARMRRLGGSPGGSGPPTSGCGSGGHELLRLLDAGSDERVTDNDHVDEIQVTGQVEECLGRGGQRQSVVHHGLGPATHSRIDPGDPQPRTRRQDELNVRARGHHRSPEGRGRLASQQSTIGCQEQSRARPNRRGRCDADRRIDAMEKALVGRSAKDALREAVLKTALERERAVERHTATVARHASGTASSSTAPRTLMAEMPKTDPRPRPPASVRGRDATFRQQPGPLRVRRPPGASAGTA